MSTTETTPGRAAYEAGGLGWNDAPWSALTTRDKRVWEEAASAAIGADPRWPRCPDGCGCRLGAGDADRRDCGCDGPCAAECRENGYPDALSYRDLAVRHVMDELDAARAELAGSTRLIRQLERITAAWTRGMYAARIDCWRGDVKAAAACLSEGLDGYDGPQWDGTETGAGWWERTKAEEGL